MAVAIKLLAQEPLRYKRIGVGQQREPVALGAEPAEKFQVPFGHCREKTHVSLPALIHRDLSAGLLADPAPELLLADQPRLKISEKALLADKVEILFYVPDSQIS